LEFVVVDYSTDVARLDHCRRATRFGEQPGQISSARDVFVRFRSKPAQRAYVDAAAPSVAWDAQVFVEPRVVGLDLVAKPMGKFGIFQAPSVASEQPEGPARPSRQHDKSDVHECSLAFARGCLRAGIRSIGIG
jgi:hypothetical protein